MDVWNDIEAHLAPLDVAEASVTSVRPKSRDPEVDGVDSTDPNSTAYWLMQSEDGAPESLDSTLRDQSLRILEPIAEGGMGAVFRAQQAGLGREVAVKMITVDEPGALAQFVAEARITGLVEHANVVPLHNLSRSPDGTPQITMKLVAGTTLRDLVRCDEPPPLDDLVRVLIKVCHALEHAHARQIIHRDIKPTNVMVGDYDQVFLLDWGVAVGLDEAMCAQRGLLFVEDVDAPAGTPAYMAPELAVGDGMMQGTHTDVYLLGATLHEVLTGRPPHRGSVLRDVLAAAVTTERQRYDDDVPFELGEAANRAMSLEADDRYPDVASFRKALEAYLEHRFANELAETGLAVLAGLEALVAAHADADANARAQIDEKIHREHAEATFAFRQAMATWAGARGARDGLVRAAELMIEYAVRTRDLPLAERVLRDLDDASAQQQVVELRAQLDDERAEVEALRKKARRLDWSRVGPVLGRVFVLGGVLGAAELLATQRLVAGNVPNGLLINGAMWLGTACVVGIYARRLVKRVALTDSVVSPRMLGTWFAVSLGCLAVGLFNQLRPTVTLSHDLSYPALLMGVGFVAMALQTRRWLLAPAGLFYAGALGVALRPQWGYEILSSVWLVAMVGVGLALRSGAQLGQD